MLYPNYPFPGAKKKVRKVVICVKRLYAIENSTLRGVNLIDFDSRLEFDHHFSGRFDPPGSDWIHLTRVLEDYELMLVVEGTLYIAADETEYEVHPGEYLLMPPCRFQHGTRKGSAGFYWLHFSYHNDLNDHVEIDASLQDRTTLPGHILLPVKGRLDSPDRIIILWKQLMDSEKRYHDVTLNRYLTGAILCELSDAMRSKERSQKDSAEQLVSDINTYISWHLQENLRVSDLATYFGYNSKYLTTLYRQHTGVALKSYLLSTKLSRAQALLTETTTPVSQIAYSLGWQDVHNFSNCFRSHTGMTPSQYRAVYTEHFVFNK